MSKIKYEIKQLIINDYFKGIGTTTLSKRYNVSTLIIYCWINRIKNENNSMITNINRHKKTKSLRSKTNKEKIMVINDLMRKFKVSLSLILRAVKLPRSTYYYATKSQSVDKKQRYN